MLQMCFNYLCTANNYLCLGIILSVYTETIKFFKFILMNEYTLQKRLNIY